MKRAEKNVCKVTYVYVGGIRVEVARKKIKGVYLRVIRTDGRIRISVPYRMSDARICAFLQSKQDWIKKNLSQSFPIQPKAEEKNGVPCTLVIFGIAYKTEVIERFERGIELCGTTAYLYLRNSDTAEYRSKFVREYAKRLLSEKISGLISYWQGKTGLLCSSWCIREMKTRWGSCSVKTRRIRFAFCLYSKSDDMISYVVLHELAHIKIPGHGRDFKAYLDTYMPSWRIAKKLLNSY